MANSINSQTSGTGGLISTASGTDGNLNIQSNGSTVGAFTSSGLTVTGVVTATTLVGNGAAITNLPSAGLNDYSKFVNSTEVITLTASAATGTLNFDTNTQLVQWYTTTATGNWILNVRASSGETLNSKLVVGQCITLVMIAATGTNTYYPTQLNIDGTAQTGTARTRWLGGAPTSAAGDATTTAKVYTYTIVKTADAIFYTIASQADYS
jgi:hypothetical protein